MKKNFVVAIDFIDHEDTCAGGIMDTIDQERHRARSSSSYLEPYAVKPIDFSPTRLKSRRSRSMNMPTALRGSHMLITALRGGKQQTVRHHKSIPER